MKKYLFSFTIKLYTAVCNSCTRKNNRHTFQIFKIYIPILDIQIRIYLLVGKKINNNTKFLFFTLALARC